MLEFARTLSLGALLVSASAWSNTAAGLPPETAVNLDGADPGRTFEGIGGLSAGAASRLLIDYPEPQRAQILDFLFEPNFGAALQHLKVEIGGGVNSTWGSEPSHADTRAELDYPRPESYERGYEWWLMKEARKRNPDIYLEGLQWGAPGWIGNGEFFSQDNADFIAGFVKGARDYHGLTLNYQGIRNEAGYKVGWIKTLRQTLDAHGLRDVKLVAADDAGDVEWKIAKDVQADPELSKAVYALGVHYVPYTTTDIARNTGKPLWFSEAAMYGEPWGRAKNFARLYNRNYILGRITKTVVCTPITSLFNYLVPFGIEMWNNPGLMKANTPWSGHYEVPPSIWVTAHTTQFARPGWRYINGGCGFLKIAGSYVTLRSPDPDGDYSIVVETMNNLPYDQACQNTNAKDEDADVPPQRITFHLKGLSAGTVHVWRSNKSTQFERLADLTPEHGSFAMTLAGNSIYTLTTTTGQRKGSYRIPKPAPFPFPYKENFERYTPGRMARYFSDQEGTFAVAQRGDGRGKCLRQVLPQRGIKWFVNMESPWTITGAAAWTDYEVSADVRVEKTGLAGLYGRVDTPLSGPMPGGYGLTIDHSGAWQLKDANVLLKSGKVKGRADSWHSLKLRFRGLHVIAAIDGQTVCTVMDDFHPNGAVALASSYDSVDFDNLIVKRFSGRAPSPAPECQNLALGKQATASGQSSGDCTAGEAVDGNHATGWCSGKTTNQWLEVDFGKEAMFDRVTLDQHKTNPWASGGDITSYKIQYWDGADWKDAFVGRSLAARRHSDDFPAVTSRKVRLLLAACGENTVVWEFQVFRTARP